MSFNLYCAFSFNRLSSSSISEHREGGNGGRREKEEGRGKGIEQAVGGRGEGGRGERGGETYCGVSSDVCWFWLVGCHQ